MSQPGDALTQRRPATLTDLAAVPSTHTGHLINGTLYAFPRPRLRHTQAETRLASTLDPPFGQGINGPGGWFLIVEPELHLGSNAIVPDLAGWRREGLDIEALDPYPTVAPAWVCEVLSPSTEPFDRGAKAESMARHGVEWLWFVDPEARTLEVFRNDAGTWRQQGRAWRGETTVSAPPFETLGWPLDVLWR